MESLHRYIAIPLTINLLKQDQEQLKVLRNAEVLTNKRDEIIKYLQQEF